MTTQNFLVEIGTEELPPKALKTLATSFADNVEAELNQAGLSFDKIEWFAAPRRLAVKVLNLATQQPSKEIEKRRRKSGSYRRTRKNSFAGGKLGRFGAVGRQLFGKLHRTRKPVAGLLRRRLQGLKCSDIFSPILLFFQRKTRKNTGRITADFAVR